MAHPSPARSRSPHQRPTIRPSQASSSESTARPRRRGCQRSVQRRLEHRSAWPTAPTRSPRSRVTERQHRHVEPRPGQRLQLVEHGRRAEARDGRLRAIRTPRRASSFAHRAGIVYIFVSDDTSQKRGTGPGLLHAWKGNRAGIPTAFTELDAAHRPTGPAGTTDVIGSPDARLDRAGIVHLLYTREDDDSVVYQTFSTVTDTWGPVTVIATDARRSLHVELPQARHPQRDHPGQQRRSSHRLLQRQLVALPEPARRLLEPPGHPRHVRDTQASDARVRLDRRPARLVAAGWIVAAIAFASSTGSGPPTAHGAARRSLRTATSCTTAPRIRGRASLSRPPACRTSCTSIQRTWCASGTRSGLDLACRRSAGGGLHTRAADLRPGRGHLRLPRTRPRDRLRLPLPGRRGRQSVVQHDQARHRADRRRIGVGSLGPVPRDERERHRHRVLRRGHRRQRRLRRRAVLHGGPAHARVRPRRRRRHRRRAGWSPPTPSTRAAARQ